MVLRRSSGRNVPLTTNAHSTEIKKVANKKPWRELAPARAKFEEPKGEVRPAEAARALWRPHDALSPALALAWAIHKEVLADESALAGLERAAARQANHFPVLPVRHGLDAHHVVFRSAMGAVHR